jgi:hypothetical protein
MPTFLEEMERQSFFFFHLEYLRLRRLKRTRKESERGIKTNA